MRYEEINDLCNRTQIPIVIQRWNEDDAKLLVQNLLDRKIIPKKYHEIVEGNLDAIAKAVEPNPREVKRS